MSDDIFKEVRFDQYCSRCEEKDTKERDGPGDDCFAKRINQYSNKRI